MSHNPYRVLGVGRKTTDDEVRTAFHNTIKGRHPDQNGGQVDPLFTMAMEAYNKLKTQDKRDLLQRQMAMLSPACGPCAGTGYITRQRGFTGVEESICAVCAGAGYTIG